MTVFFLFATLLRDAKEDRWERRRKPPTFSLFDGDMTAATLDNIKPQDSNSQTWFSWTPHAWQDRLAEMEWEAVDYCYTLRIKTITWKKVQELDDNIATAMWLLGKTMNVVILLEDDDDVGSFIKKLFVKRTAMMGLYCYVASDLLYVNAVGYALAPDFKGYPRTWDIPSGVIYDTMLFVEENDGVQTIYNRPQMYDQVYHRSAAPKNVKGPRIEFRNRDGAIYDAKTPWVWVRYGLSRTCDDAGKWIRVRYAKVRYLNTSAPWIDAKTIENEPLQVHVKSLPRGCSVYNIWVNGTYQSLPDSVHGSFDWMKTGKLTEKEASVSAAGAGAGCAAAGAGAGCATGGASSAACE